VFRYAHAYFVENRSLIPDEEYDALMNELRDLEELFPQYKDAESPTQVVGAKVRNAAAGENVYTNPSTNY